MKDWARRHGTQFAVSLVVLLLISRFIALGWTGLLANTSSDSGDQGAYLVMGLDIREGRALTDGNRHPLFPLLIAPFAQREWSYFTLAKMVSLAVGGLALLLVYVLGQRLYGPGAAVVAVALLSLNGEWLDQTPQALGEALLVLTFFVAWAMGMRALEQPTSGKMGALAGACAGLAYLTNTTARGAGLVSLDTLRRYFAPVAEEILKALILIWEIMMMYKEFTIVGERVDYLYNRSAAGGTNP